MALVGLAYCHDVPNYIWHYPLKLQTIHYLGTFHHGEKEILESRQSPHSPFFFNSNQHSSYDVDVFPSPAASVCITVPCKKEISSNSTMDYHLLYSFGVQCGAMWIMHVHNELSLLAIGVPNDLQSQATYPHHHVLLLPP